MNLGLKVRLLLSCFTSEELKCSLLSCCRIQNRNQSQTSNGNGGAISEDQV